MPTNPLAITTDSFIGYGLDRAFEITAAAGFDGIEVSIRHDDFDTQDAEYIRKLSERHHLPIVAVSAPADITPEQAEHAVDLAIAVGAPVISVTPPDLFDFHYKKWITEEMRAVRKKKKIHIALVNAPAQMVLGILPKYSITSMAELKAFPDVALDTSNTASKSEPLIEIYAALKPNVVHVYLANSKGDRDHTLLSEGNLPLESLLTRLARDEYTGALALRLNPKSLRVGTVDRVLENLDLCKKFIAKYHRTEF